MVYKKTESLPFVETLDDYHNQIAVRNLSTSALMAIDLRDADSKIERRWLAESLDFCQKSADTLKRLVEEKDKPTVDNFLSKIFIDLALSESEQVDTNRLQMYKENFDVTLNVLQQIQKKEKPKDIMKSKLFLKSFIEAVKATYSKTESQYFGYLSPK